MPAPSRSALGLAALLAGAGATHFALPGYYDAMIPDLLPGRPRQWTTGAGVAEFAVAAAIVVPPTRRVGALAAAGLFAAVLPANVKVAVDARKSDSLAFKIGTVLRLPMQWPLIAWALKVRRDS